MVSYSPRASDATAIDIVFPEMGSGGHLAVSTSGTAGATFVPFAAQACKQLTIANNTGTVIEVQQGGTGVALPVFSGSYFTFFAAGDASSFAVRRVDQVATAVAVQARWEA